MLEILAPVGNEEMLRAAVLSGADAVYLGLKQLNARRSAGNFDETGLKMAVSFCHARNVRVYLVLNITPTPAELAQVEKALSAAAQAGVDAIIVQDFAVASLARQMVPNLPLHASTQMNIHNLQGVLQAAEMGFSRVIPARELTLAEIELLCKESPIEIEVFIHGALCMAVSGQCYMSAFLGGRSANRGACAGPCRLPFSAGGEGAHHLSLKDHSHISHLPKLMQAGVSSVKIEGRMRTPEYVAAAVTACIAAREGKPFDQQILQDVFSRSGFTDGYLTGKRDKTMFGVRTQQDLQKAKQAMPKLREHYRRERSNIPVELTFDIQEDEIKLSATDLKGFCASSSKQVQTQPAENDLSASYQRALEKTGGTPFYVKSLVQTGRKDLYVQASVVNQLRREVLEQLMAMREQTNPWQQQAATWVMPQQRKIITQTYSARFQTAQQYQAVCEAGLYEMLDFIQIPAEQWQQIPQEYRKKVWLEPLQCEFSYQEKTALTQLAKEVATEGFAGWVVQNVGHLHLFQESALIGGFGLNITNPLAAKTYYDQGLRLLTVNMEVPCTEMRAIANAGQVAALIYGYMPLMVTRACPLKNVRTCANCPREGVLKDRKNMEFLVRCTGPNGFRTIYNPIALYAADRVKEIPADVLVLYFTKETPERTVQVLQMAMQEKPYDEKWTRGLLFKPREDA